MSVLSNVSAVFFACCLARPALAGEPGDPASPAQPQQTDGQKPGPGFGSKDETGPGSGPRPRDLIWDNAAAEFESAKTRIRASDEEWKVIGPKLQKVVFARQQAGFALDPDYDLFTDSKGDMPDAGRGRERGGPGNGAFAGPSSKAEGDFGPGGGPPPGFGPGRGPPPRFGPGGGPPPDFRPRGGPPPGFGGPDSAAARALAALRTALADPKSSPQGLQEKVAELRAVRERAQRDLVNAEKDLLELLTEDQEATLVSLGYIE